ncbi:hypothetical protein V8F44DRAFT_590623 [Aspergillus fumigatus]
MSITSSILQLILAVIVLMASVVDHSRSPRPLILLNSCLFGFSNSLSGITIYYTRLGTSIDAIIRLKTFNETVMLEDCYSIIVPGRRTLSQT